MSVVSLLKLVKLKDSALVNVNGVSRVKTLVITKRLNEDEQLWRLEMLDREDHD